MLIGNPVSRGVAIAPAYVYRPEKIEVAEKYLDSAQTDVAIAAVHTAVSKADSQLVALIESFSVEEAEQSKIFSAHREILQDEELHEEIMNAILSGHASAEFAVYSACNQFIELLSQAQDANITMRTADITDVRDRLIRILRNEEKQDLSCLPSDCILIAHELLPSDTASMDRTHVLGIITEVGGSTSHTAILANSFRIPAVVGISFAMDEIADGDMVLIDAFSGEVTVQPSGKAILEGRRKREAWLQENAEAAKCLMADCNTKDGMRIEIGVNIGSDKEEVPEYADFVGLFRTEFLYMNSDHMPTEEEQFVAYRRVLENARGKPVTLRTLDIGGDKTLPYFPLPQEQNPFLGIRALRLCLQEPAIFKTQLRAALRASVYGDLWMMLPMVGSLEDIHRAKRAIAEVEQELHAKGIAFNPDYKLGIMVEVPSIALVADLAAKEVDFASIGTNDLCQYISAADRMNSSASVYYQTLSPAMVRILRQVISAFTTAGKPISVCGELGGNAQATELLVGLGLRKLSMNECNIALVKQRILQTSVDDAAILAKDAMQLPTQEAVLDLLQSRHKRQAFAGR